MILENKTKAIVIDKLKGINAINGEQKINELINICSMVLPKQSMLLIHLNNYSYTLNMLQVAIKTPIASEVLIGRAKAYLNEIKVNIV